MQTMDDFRYAERSASSTSEKRMGKTRGGRRHVLQLNDNKESYLARYGYNRQEEDDGGAGDDDGSDEEPGNSTQSTPERLEPPEKKAGVPDTPDIDDKVANFLAEIDALDQNDAEAEGEDEEEEEARPSFRQEVEIPPPTFQLNPHQQPDSGKPEAELEKPSYSRHNGKKAYGSMFVKGESEFVKKKDESVLAQKAEEVTEWPEEPTTVWQQTLDDNTQCYYYWNTVTNEVTWEIPPEFTQYLLRYKDYEEKVDKLKKEGKVKPPTQKKPENNLAKHAPSMSGSSSTNNLKSDIGSKLIPEKIDRTVAEGSVTSTSDPEPGAKESHSGPQRSKAEASSILPDSTISKSKSTQPKLVAYFGGSSEESSTDSSEDSDSSDEDDKKRKRKPVRKGGTEQEEEDIDIDDIDKALEMALEKKTTDKDSSSTSKSSSKSSREKKSEEKGPKSKSLVDVMRETVQKKQEVEARRKAAIEEMMARELERRVGPPRKRPTPEEPTLHSGWESKKPKVMEYEHGRKHRRSDEYEHSLSKSSSERESRHKHEDRKKHKKEDKDRDRRKDKDDSRKKDDHGKRKDKHEDKHRDKDEKKKHKDKDKDKDRERDEKKKDKKRDRDRDREDSKKEKDSSSKKEETKKEEKKKPKDAEEAVEEPKIPDVKIKPEIISPVPKSEENPRPVSTAEVKEEPKENVKVKVDVDENEASKLTPVQLANLKLEASELAELALSKLEFLEVTKKGLSKLQILLIELETRQNDWQSGGLKTEFFLTKLEEANWQLQQYEQSAAPPGWSCHWDRAYRRYFYMNKKSGRTQWDYPDDDEDEEEEEACQEVEMELDLDQGKDRSSSVSPDKESMEIVPPEEPANQMMSVNSVQKDQEKQGIGVMESEVVSSTTVNPAEVDKVMVDATSLMPSLGGEGHYQVPSNVGSITQTAPPLPPSEPVSQTSYDLDGTAAVSVLRGEPPPPGTDLDILLAAPPPPPPPPETEKPSEPLRDHQLESHVIEQHQQIAGPSFLGSQYDQDRLVYGTDSRNCTVDESGVSEKAVGSSDLTLQQSDGIDNGGREPAVIARQPQVISREAQMFGESVPDIPVEPPAPPSEQSVTSADVNATGGSGDSSTSGYSEKKKKKKDKSISSSSLTLKKKNVSSLVQKWQKVKKEVEIEERYREEREMAIRQKLEEWKQEHS